MNLASIDKKVSELTKADTIAYPTENRVINYNIWNQKAVTIILDSQDNSDFNDANRGYSILTEDLVANQRDYRFGISNGVVSIKRVDISYDGEKSYRAQPIDSAQIDIGLIEGQTNIDSYFTKQTPYYDWKYNAFFLYPLPTEDVGQITVEVSRTAKDITEGEYTTGTMLPGFDENFHPFVAYGMAYEHFLANTMTEMATQTLQILSDYEFRMRRQYGKKEGGFPLRFDSQVINYN